MSWLVAAAVDDGVALLTDDEERHLARTLRARPGAAVRLIDGRGTRAVGSWRGGREVEVHERERWPAPARTLVLGLGARASNEDALRRAAELGVGTIWPVLAERSRDAGAGKRLDTARWQRILWSGCAQAGNPWLPDLQPVGAWAAAKDALGADAMVALDPKAAEPLAALDPVPTTVAVGPEGGFTDAELEGCRRAGLGRFVLRTPVAVAAALAVLEQRSEAPCAA